LGPDKIHFFTPIISRLATTLGLLGVEFFKKCDRTHQNHTSHITQKTVVFWIVPQPSFQTRLCI